MNKEELTEVLKQHKLWLDSGGVRGERADLRYADLSGADLSDADLSDAILRNANLRNANLWNANLIDANLWNANLRNANLWNANLRNAYLIDANLIDANLIDADLSDAILRNAYLSNANLSNANLSNADLRWCRGNSQEIKSLHIGMYDICYTSTRIFVGCRAFTLQQMVDFSLSEAEELGEVEFFERWGDWIKDTVTRFPAVPYKENT